MSKELSIREEMRLRMDGRLPFEREHPKEGESRFYYNDPRGRKGSFSLLSEMKTIDVPNKDSPNPYLKDIIEDEANRDPENHYIWRTVGDDKVRSRIKTAVAPAVFTARGVALSACELA